MAKGVGMGDRFLGNLTSRIEEVRVKANGGNCHPVCRALSNNRGQEEHNFVKSCLTTLAIGNIRK